MSVPPVAIVSRYDYAKRMTGDSVFKVTESPIASASGRPARAVMSKTKSVGAATALLATLVTIACTRHDSKSAGGEASARDTAARQGLIPADAASTPTAEMQRIFDGIQAQLAADSRLTPSEIYALPDDRFVTELWRRLAAKDSTRPLSGAELAIVCVMDLDAEVRNGGFSQFFFNSSGDHASDTGSALRQVGLTRIAALYDRALKAFPGTPLRDTGARRRQMHEVSGETEVAWMELDSAYYKTADDAITAVVARFARGEAKNIAP